MDNLIAWIYREARHRARNLEDSIVRRLVVEAGGLNGTPESEIRAQLAGVLKSMQITGAVTRQEGHLMKTLAEQRQRMWAEAKTVWEEDARPGYAWLARDLSLPVTGSAVRNQAIKNGWLKRAGTGLVSPEAGRP